MITIFIDNRPYQVREDQNLLQACLTLGFDLPYFCWHPAMHSVGACRQCAVKQFKDEQDTRGKIVMSCMTPVSDGMRISVDDPEAQAFRGNIIEMLMLNHPHDCPVCDEGGECHLQDMTVMTGHAARRTRFRKRTHRNQDLGPFLHHEMNRCIQCYRCVRFYRDIAGGRDLNVFAAHDSVYFGRHEDGTLESEFSGNLVEVCPTGVFTDKTLKRHYTRKWDLQTAPSVCVHCGVGCNTIAAERSGTLRRILNRYHHDVNGYFLCDRGRFGYAFVNSEARIRSVALAAPSPPGNEVRGEGILTPGKEQVLAHVAALLSGAKGVIGIGSPRASLESNFMLRQLVGQDKFFAGMGTREQRVVSLIIDVLAAGPARTPSLREMQEADAVLVLGEDLPNTAPLVSLALRRTAREIQAQTAREMKVPAWHDAAVRNAAGPQAPLFIATPEATRLDDIASGVFRAPVADIARFGHAVAHAIDAAAPGPAGLAGAAPGQARTVAESLLGAKRPLVVSGSGLMSEAVVRAAANISRALSARGRECLLSFAVAECNSLGSALMGGRSLDEAFAMMQDGIADTVIILENDLFLRADGQRVRDLLDRARQVVVLDHLRNPTSVRAHVLLPSSTFAEAPGTLVSHEGRAQRFYQVFRPAADIQPAWKWFDAIMGAMGRRETAAGPASLDSVIAALAGALPVFGPVRNIAPDAGFLLQGQKVPRQPHRFSGRTALTADRDVSEPRPPEDPDSPLAFSMEGSEAQPPAPLIARYWAAGWNSVQSLNKFQLEVGGPLRGGDPGVRLIEPGSTEHAAYFEDRSEDDASPADAPRYRVFGSDELSRYAPAILERMRRG